jgi:hypothetical protein
VVVIKFPRVQAGTALFESVIQFQKSVKQLFKAKPARFQRLNYIRYLPFTPCNALFNCNKFKKCDDVMWILWFIVNFVTGLYVK